MSSDVAVAFQPIGERDGRADADGESAMITNLHRGRWCVSSNRSVVKFVVGRVLRAIRHRVARARVTQRARSAHTVDCESTVCATVAVLPTSRCALK